MSTHTFDLDHDREHAALRMRASQLICQRGVISSVDEHIARAVGQLLHAVSSELTADGHSVPLSVQRAVLRVADSLVGADHLSTAPKTRQDVPFTACIRLGRMG